MKLMQKNSFAIKCYLPSEISSELLNDIEAFTQSIDSSLPDNHIEKNHLNWLNLELYVVFENKKICALFSYSSNYVTHPIDGKRIFISVGGLSYKQKSTEVKNLTKVISIIHMKKHLGFFWFFKKFIAVAKTVNPRVYVQFYVFFPILHPSKLVTENSVWHDFLSKHLSLIEKHPVILNEYLVDNGKPIFDARLNITDSYNLYYKSKNTLINNYFIDNGIFIKEEEQIYLTNKSLVVVGEYSFNAMVLKSANLVLKKIWPTFISLFVKRRKYS